MSENTNRGIGLFIASQFVGALVDTPAKYLLAHGVALSMVVFFRYVIAFALLITIFIVRGNTPPASQHKRVNILRGLLLTSSTFLNFYSLQNLPLAVVMSINFAAPLLSCALAPFLLGEYVGPRRWAAVVVGFVGVLIVMRPGGAVFHLAMVTSLMNATVIALYQIFTRRAGAGDHPETGLTYVFAVGAVITACVVPFHWQMPAVNLWPVIALMGTCGLVTHLIISHALRLAPASLLAPFIYLNIIWITVFGIVIFGDWPDQWTTLGSTIIIASGFYVWLRERVRSQPAN
ncbi:MAG: DMT family transporter [Alphaproteobacteria bacterium]|nr:DMT family transporter [Alphaproteobacteria bacterium]